SPCGTIGAVSRWPMGVCISIRTMACCTDSGLRSDVLISAYLLIMLAAVLMEVTTSIFGKKYHQALESSFCGADPTHLILRQSALLSAISAWSRGWQRRYS